MAASRHTQTRKLRRTHLLTLTAAAAVVITGISAGPIGASDTPAVQFGSHQRPYATGSIKPSTAAATMDADTKAFYQKWKAKYLVSACGNGLAISSPDADHPFVAEAQGYGLEIFALMAGADPDAKVAFDGVLKFVLAHPSSITPGLLAAEQDSSCRSVNGADSATDGDLAIAYGLLLADKQWGSAGTYDYRDLAIARINAIKQAEIHPTTKLPLLGDWSSAGDKYYTSTRPSDFMIDHFRAFKAATGDITWDQVAAVTSNLINQQQTTYAPSTGLIADFVVSTTTSPKPAPANFLEGSTDGQYSWNSLRVPWHLGTDALVSGDSASKAQSQRLTAWIKTKTGGNPSQVRSGYTLDGTTAASYLSPEFVATLGPAAMSDASNQAWLDAIWNYTAAASKSSSGIAFYYGSSLILQNMIVMSGNYWTPTSDAYPAPTPTSTPAPAPTPTATPSPTPTSTTSPTPAPTPTPTASPTPTPTATTAPASLGVTLKYTAKWRDGYCAAFLVTNKTATKVSRFKIGFDLPTNVGLSDKWNGPFVRSGTDSP